MLHIIITTKLLSFIRCWTTLAFGSKEPKWFNEYRNDRNDNNFRNSIPGCYEIFRYKFDDEIDFVCTSRLTFIGINSIKIQFLLDTSKKDGLQQVQRKVSAWLRTWVIFKLFLQLYQCSRGCQKLRKSLYMQSSESSKKQNIKLKALLAVSYEYIWYEQTPCISVCGLTFHFRDKKLIRISQLRALEQSWRAVFCDVDVCPVRHCLASYIRNMTKFSALIATRHSFLHLSYSKITISSVMWSGRTRIKN